MESAHLYPHLGHSGNDDQGSILEGVKSYKTTKGSRMHTPIHVALNGCGALQIRYDPLT